MPSLWLLIVATVVVVSLPLQKAFATQDVSVAGMAQVYDQVAFQNSHLTLGVQLSGNNHQGNAVMKVTTNNSQETRMLTFRPVKFAKQGDKLFIVGEADGAVHLYRVESPSTPPYWVKRLVNKNQLSH